MTHYNATMTDIKKRHHVKLGDIEHVLIRPSRYIGSIEPVLESRFILNRETNKLEFREIRYRPAIVKCAREVLDNCIDECQTCQEKLIKGTGTTIDITTKGANITIEDNGRGIPVEQNDDKEWIPELCWTSLRAGSKFEDDAAAIGQNGEGASLVAIFSKSFIAESFDGVNHFKMVCTDNLKNKDIKVKPSNKHGTCVSFELGGKGEIKLPEKNKEYDLDVLAEAMRTDSIYEDIFMTDVILLSIAYPTIRFRVNGKEIRFKKFAEFAKMLGDDDKVELMDAGPIKIAVAHNPSAQMNFMQFINGINACEGGDPIDWVVNTLTFKIMEKLQKRYKNIKPSDIRNHLTFAAFFNGMPNPRFSNQTKTKCVNSASQFKEITKDVDFDILAKQVLKNDFLTDPMIETYKIKEEFEKRKALQGSDKEIGAKKIRPKNFMPASDYAEFLVLTEGESAKYGIAQVLGRDRFGYFGLRGKALNCHEVDLKKIADNQEIIAIRQILGISLSQPNQTRFSYEKILVATDADSDGTHIRALVLTMFNRLAKEMVKNGNVKILRTPLVTLSDSKGKVVAYFFDLKTANEWKSKNNISRLTENYFKGLGKWGGENSEILAELIRKDGIGHFIVDFTWDDETDKMFDAWMGRDTSYRKEALVGRSFDISLQ